MLFIIGMLFLVWCAYEWGRSAKERDDEFQKLREQMDRLASKDRG